MQKRADAGSPRRGVAALRGGSCQLALSRTSVLILPRGEARKLRAGGFRKDAPHPGDRTAQTAGRAGGASGAPTAPRPPGGLGLPTAWSLSTEPLVPDGERHKRLRKEAGMFIGKLSGDNEAM